LADKEKPRYAIGLDFGTNSVRTLIVDVRNGNEVGTAIFNYPTGDAGIILDPKDPNLARQNPADWIEGIEVTVREAVAAAGKKDREFVPEGVIGIGVDTTGSTPLPVDRAGKPLAFYKEFRKDPNAHAWLWKDHTGHREAAEITALAAGEHPEYLAKCGGTYSSEWFWSKILHALRVDPKVSAAAFSWVECADYIPAALTGTSDPLTMKRSRCAAGHKAMFNDAWGGLPARDFLAKLDPRLGELRDRLYKKTYTADIAAGTLTKDWAKKLGLRPGIQVAVGAFDAHLGAVGAGVDTGRFVKIIGTSTCDICVWPAAKRLPDIPGLCGIVDGSVLPGYLGLEAGQSAVGVPSAANWHGIALAGAESEPAAAPAGAVTRDVLGYDDPTVDGLFTQAQSELNAKADASLYNEIDTLLWQNLPTLPLFQASTTLVRRVEVVNVSESATWAGPSSRTGNPRIT